MSTALTLIRPPQTHNEVFVLLGQLLQTLRAPSSHPLFNADRYVPSGGSVGELEAKHTGIAPPSLAVLSSVPPNLEQLVVQADLQVPSLILQTSGTQSANAKLVVLPSSSLLASAKATEAALSGPGAWLLALPAHHIAGIQVLVRSIVAGTTPTLLDSWPRFGPKQLVRAAEEARRSNPGLPLYTSLVSAQLDSLLNADAEVLSKARLIDSILVGGGRIADRLLVRASEAGLRVVTTYGMTETSGGCVYDGVPLEGTRLLIESECEQEPGTILISGSTLMTGYLGGSEVDVQWWVSPNGTRYFRTSDIGRCDLDGRLHVLGRSDDLVKSGGVQIVAGVVTDFIQTLPLIADAVCVGIDNERYGQTLAALIVLAPGSTALTLEEAATAVRQAVREEFGPAHQPRTIALTTELPRGTLGKVNLAKVRRTLASAIRTNDAWQR